MKKLINLGCKLNQYEGYCLLKRYSGAEDVVVVNTCCVTHEAEIKSLKKYRYALRTFKNATVIVTGCLCRMYPEKFSGAHQIIDNVARNALIADVLPTPERSRYFLKIEDGCVSTCTFCVVRNVRQVVESKSLEDVEREIGWAVAHGYHEIVLVGANIGLYGRERGLSLATLLEHLATIPDMPRIRLSSLEPSFVTPDILKRLRDIPFCRHIHIPIQSADDEVLGRMGRPYRAADLDMTVELISSQFDDIAIGADVIVGFPGEDRPAFERTAEFIEQHPFTHIHVFTYSPRPGTEAFTCGDPVPHHEKKRRSRYLYGMVREKNYAFRKTLQEKAFDIVLEKTGPRCAGLTDNYVRVLLERCPVPGGVVRALITDVTRTQTTGQVVPDGTS
ncbi:MAG: radical SAM protein [candidate division WOR-3 bacterium]|nr:MAG: radical SAM protein [candidate division WOR-3 bacterium]